MNLTEYEINQNYARKCMQFTRNMLLPNEYEWSCVACGYNVIKRKKEIGKISRKKLLE